MKSQGYRILVVDDDVEYAETCATVIGRAGYAVQAKTTAEEALDAIRFDDRIRLVLTDLRMAGTDGLELLRRIKAQDETVEVVIMTGFGSIDSAIEAIRSRAAEYITKPFDKDELLNAISTLYDMWTLQHEVRQLRRVLGDRLRLEGFLFKNEKMAVAYKRALAAAQSDCSVLITGESGTGKDLIARAIHNSSDRKSGPFVAVNCSTLTGDLMGSELYGHRRGAFTGAEHDHKGLFLAAETGTLFLDEIVEMPQELQAKLLRSIQDRSIRPVGSVEEVGVDIRFISATNIDLSRALSEKRLREDLYHRLNVIPIHLPPLREMSDEIPALVDYLIERANEKHPHKVSSVDKSVMDLLMNRSWPGNIRELQNLIERFFSVERAEVINVQNLTTHLSSTTPGTPRELESTPRLSEAERELVVRALREAKGNKSRAAEILGISRPRLYKKIELYNLQDLQL